MSANACGTLSAVFPLVLLAVIGLRAALHPQLRRLRLYRISIRLTIVCSLAGVLAVVIGQQLDGYTGPIAVPIWSLFGVDVICLGFSILAASATSELEEEPDDTEPPAAD